MGKQLKLCSANINGTAVSTLSNAQWSAGMEKYIGGASGNYQGEFCAVMRQIPAVSLTTRKINALEAVVFGAGNLIFREQEEGGTGNTTYKSLTGTNNFTLWIPRRISWAPGGPATLSVDGIFLSSTGAAAPITVGTTSGSLAAEADIWVGNEEQCDSIDLDFGYQIALPQDGFLYGKHCFIESQRPRLTVRHTHLDNVTTANVNPGSLSTLTATLAKVSEGGVRGTAFTISATGIVHVGDIASGSPAAATFTVDGKGGITFG
jgi:hypothetical protein